MVWRLRSVAPFAVLALLCLPAVYPYLGGDVPRTNDLTAHVYRAFELEQLALSGTLFPRWGPHLVHGYGFPVYNYFPYLSHYLITITHLVSGLGFLWAYRLVVIGVIIASSYGAFLLGRDLFKSEAAGLLGGVAFVYSPYLLLTAHVRGGLPESLALAVFPFVLWMWRRAAHGKRSYITLGAVAYATLVVSHHGFAVQVSPVLLVFALWAGRINLIRAIRYTAVTAIAGLCLSAFYWLPALAELGFAQINEGYASAGIVYYNNFSPIRALFRYPPIPVDSDMLNPPVSNPVPVVTLGLAILATIFGLRAERSIRDNLNSISILAVFCLFLVLPQSQLIWDLIPLLQRTLWPWRLVGPGSLFLALVAGVLATCPWQKLGYGGDPSSFKFQFVSGPILVVLVMANGLPWLYPPREPITAPEDVADLAAYELPPWLIGTTCCAEYLPKWVAQLPDSTGQQATLYSDRDPDRLDRSRLPSGTVAEHRVNELLREQYHLELPSDVTLSFRHFFFPGWRATLDERPIPIRVTNPHGLISIDVPAGTHTLDLYFGPTPVRRIAVTLSLTSLLLIVYSLSVGKRDKLRITPSSSHFESEPLYIPMNSPSLPAYCFASLIIIPLFLASAYIDNPLRRHGLSSGNQPVKMEHRLGMDFEGELWLHGYSLSQQTISADEDVQLDLYWQAQKPLGVVYGFNVRLRGAGGLIWNTLETVRPTGWRFVPGTDFWPPDKYILDNYAVRPLPGTPPGEYQLEVVAFHRDTLAPLGTRVVGPLNISMPDRSSYIDAAPVATMANGSITLLDLTFDRPAAAPGDLVGVHAVWHSEGVMDNYQVQLALVLPTTGESVAVFEFPLGKGYPSSIWKRGEFLRDQYVFRLPADLSAGEFEWRMQLQSHGIPTSDDYQSGVTLNVVAPDRVFQAPLLSARLNAHMGDQIMLAGYLLSKTSLKSRGSLDVTLVWQANEEIANYYHVFLHLIDADGYIVAQSDGEPADWSRPTTGWLAGEFVPDQHILQIPSNIDAGAYSLHTGLYDPDTGERLRIMKHEDGSLLFAVVDLED